MTDTEQKTVQEGLSKLSVEDPPPEGKVWHEAACHCHAVEYKILFAPIYPPYSGKNLKMPWLEEEPEANTEGKPPLMMRCNCSICNKNGYILIYPLRSEVVFTKGYETLRDYEFATCTKDHKFCPKCGSSIMIDFRGLFKRDALGMNARMIKGFDIDAIDFTKGNARSRLNPEFNDKYT